MDDEGTAPRATLFIVGAIAIAASLLIIIWGSSKQSEYDWRAQQQASENARYANYYVRNGCFSLTATDKADCAIKAHAEARKNEREEQDLVAQKTSALWTFLMGAAAVVGVMLSTIGVWLVYTTFRENKRAADVAYASLQHDRARTGVEMRPWISPKGFDSVYYGGGVVDGKVVGGTLNTNVQFINTGQLPALNMDVKVRFAVTGIDVLEAPPFDMTGDPAQVGVSAAGPNLPFNTADRPISGDDLAGLIARTKCLWLHAEVRYQRPSHEGDDYITRVTFRVALWELGVSNGKPIVNWNGRMTASAMT